MTPPSELPSLTYCVACQTVHFAPVAIAVNDRCPMNQHTRDCMDRSFLFHAATGGDLECVCGASPRLDPAKETE